VAAKFLVRTVWSRCARPCRSERNTLNGESRAIYQRKQRYNRQK
jgi:flagellar biosynthesis regulator FlaF